METKNQGLDEAVGQTPTVAENLIQVESEGKMVYSKERLTGVQKMVFLELANEGLKPYIKDIVKKTKLKQSTVYDAKNTLIAKGLIEPEIRTFPRAYKLTPKGRFNITPLLDHYENHELFYDRSHNYLFTVPILALPPKLPIGWKSWTVKHWKQSSTIIDIDGRKVEARLNGRTSVSIRFSEVFGLDAQETEDRAYHIVYATLNRLKQELEGIRFGPSRLVNVTMSSAHHALVYDPHALQCANLRLTIRSSNLSADNSTGRPELEWDGKSPAENRDGCMRYHHFVKEVSTGQVNPRYTQERVAVIEASINSMANVLQEKPWWSMWT